MNVETEDIVVAALDAVGREAPCSPRQLFFELIREGHIADASGSSWQQLRHALQVGRRAGPTRWDWFDDCSNTVGPPAWRGVGDFLLSLPDTYAKDVLPSQAARIHVIVGCGSIAPSVLPVCEELAVPLTSFVGFPGAALIERIARHWRAGGNPVRVLYLADLNPAALCGERNLHHALASVSWKFEAWERVAVTGEDIAALRPPTAAIKERDTRAKQYRALGHDRCVELAAIKPTLLRQRLTEAIKAHIHTPAWRRCAGLEKIERERIRRLVEGWRLTALNASPDKPAGRG